MRTAASAIGKTGCTMGYLLGPLIALTVFLQGVAAADETCQRKAFDPRSARLQVLDVSVSPRAITGKVQNNSSMNTSGETAVGVVVWVNYYRSSRGGLMGQQCIVVGDIRVGEEREFGTTPIPEAEGARSFDTAVAATEWR